ncbi:MAG: type II secretion system protein J [Vampirovibrionales bacterium]
MFSNKAFRRYKAAGFTLIELVVSIGVVGLVILPLLLTSTTIITKGLVDSASHTKSNFQLSEMFNQMGLVFDSSSTMARPDNFATWDPRREFQMTYYNVNRGVAEKVGYRLVNVGGTVTGVGVTSVTTGGKWYLQKLLDNGQTAGNGTGNETSSPYATLASDQVELLPLGANGPMFNYCNTSGTCTNNPAVLTPAFLGDLDSITLQMQGVQVTAPGIKQSEGRVMTGNKQFFMGKKYASQAAGDLNTASAVRVTSLTDFYGVANQNEINALSASFNKQSNTSLVLPSASQIAPVNLTAPQTLLNNTTILRVAVDQIRGNYAFVGQQGANINLYFYNAVKNELTNVTSNVSPSGRPNADFPVGDYPLVIDEFTGKVFWTSDNKGTAVNPYGKPDGGTGANRMHLLGWDPYQATLGVFLVDSRSTNLNTIAYTLIPDHQNGTLWALQDNGLTGITAQTQIVAIDTNSIATVFNQDLETIAGATQFDYINSWDITNGEGANVSGDLFLAALNRFNNKMGMIYLKANRNGNTVSITSRAMTNSVINSAPATPATPDSGARSNNRLSPNRLVANDNLRAAGFLTRTLASGTRDLYYSAATMNTLELSPLLTGSPIPPIDPPFNANASQQPSQMKQWFHNNFYIGIADSGFVPRWGDGEGALWVNKFNNDDPYFGGVRSTMTMNVTAGSFPNFTFGNLISRIIFSTYVVAYPGTGHCFHDMGVNGSQVMTNNETVRAYSAVYTGTSTMYQPIVGDNDCKKQVALPEVGGYNRNQKGVMIQRNTKTGGTNPYQNIQYFFRDMNGQDPWMIPVHQTDKVAFTYWDSVNSTYRLDVFTGSTNAFTAGADATRPTVPASFMQAAKEKDIIGINYNRMELMVTNASGDVVLWKFGGGRQNNAVARNGHFLTRQAEPGRHLRLESLGLEFVQDATSIAEDNSNAYVLLRASTRNGITKPTRLVRFKCDARLKEGAKNNSSFCYRMSELNLPAAFPNTASMDITVNQSPDATEAFLLVDSNVYRIPDRNMVGVAPNSVLTPWYTGFAQMGAGIAHSSKTGTIFIVRCGEGQPLRAGDWNIRGGADRRGLLVATVNSQGMHNGNVLIPMESWTVENAFNENTHYSGRRCGLRIDEQRGLFHIITQNNNNPANPRNFVYTFQKPTGYGLL